MEEAGGSIPPSSTLSGLSAAAAASGFSLAGLVAGEGCFTVSPLPPRNDGSPRLRFKFMLEMAVRDLVVVTALRDFLGVGSISHLPARQDGWLPTVNYSVSGRRSVRAAVLPFCDRFLVAGAKLRQYLSWRARFTEYEAHFPSNWGAGPSPCTIAGCDRPVRGRGLCRAHYYRATGY